MSKAASLFNSKPIEVKDNPNESNTHTIEKSDYKDHGPVTRKTKLRAKKKKQIMNKLASKPTKDFNENRPYVQNDMSVAQVNEREARTIFVGNVGLSTKKKAILKLFKKYGTIERMWMRSLPLDLKSKINMKGKLRKYQKFPLNHRQSHSSEILSI
jgi:RNA recognition motif-containing protein